MHSHQVVSHVLRRGVEYATSRQAYIVQLEQDAALYENSGPDMELKPAQFAPVAITVAIAAIIIWSIEYTLGEVISSLTMIESPSRTAIIDAKPPPYADEPDAPLEKDDSKLLADADVEVTVIEHKPITSKVTSTIGLLSRVGGFTARWRGLGLAILYHVAHALVANSITFFFGLGIFGQILGAIIASVCLVRLHLAWTHKMVAYPSSKSWFRRLPARKQCRALLLPALVHACAESATIILPLGVAAAFGLLNPRQNLNDGITEGPEGCHKVKMAIGFAVAVVSYLFVILAIYLPAKITRTRIEAALLPEGEEAIVPFDKEATIGDLDLSARSGCRALFAQTWKSVDRATRWRVIKLFFKTVAAQLAVALVAVHLVIAEIYVIGGERLPVFIKSAMAQLKLAAIEAKENSGN